MPAGEPAAADDPSVVDDLLRRRRTSGLVVGAVAVVLLPAWSLLDLYLEPDLAAGFIAVRFASLAPMLVLLWLLWRRPPGHGAPEVLTLGILAVVQIDICWMVAQVDNTESYASGLSLAAYGCGGVLAGPPRWTAGLLGITWTGLGAALLFAPREIPDIDVAAVVFYLASATVVALVIHARRHRLVLDDMRSRVALEREQERTRALLDRLDRLSHEDPLTGLANRRRWDAELATACAEVRASGGPVAVLLVDLDRFKQVNDRHGHAGGDAALCAVATLLRTAVRGGDLVARLGGDELAVLMPGADGARAVALAEQLRRQATTLCPESLAPGEVTLSIGVAALRGDELAPSALMARADERLYEAKRTRNAVGGPLPAGVPAPRG
ncbi:GGDEF domain-containing protein [Blastococcus sp. SYSU D00820]